MRILLVHPKINFDNMEPLGLLSLGTSLKRRGFDVLVLDIFPHDTSYFERHLDTFDPDCIGFGFETPGCARAAELIDVARERVPGAHICAGGIHVSVLPEQTLRELGLDFVVVGESELSFPRVCRALSEGKPITNLPGVGVLLPNGTFHLSPSLPLIEDLDAFAPIERTLLDGFRFYFEPPGCVRGLVRRRVANVLASRGCPYECMFCQSDFIMGRCVRMRSVENVLDEIGDLQSRFGIDTIYFADDGITVNPGWIEQFCNRKLQRGMRFAWACQSRADCLSEERVHLMKKAGCLQIDIGIESGDPSVLRYLRKSETIDEYLMAGEWVRSTGLRLLCSFVIGTPVETTRSYKLTRNLIRMLRPSMCQYFTLVPYPETWLAREALKDNVLGKMSFSDKGSQKHWDGSVLRGIVSPEEQGRAKVRLQRMTFFRDHLLLVVGWIKYPRYLGVLIAAVLRVTLANSLPATRRARNPVAFAQNVYSEFNKTLLFRARNDVVEARVWTNAS